MGYTPLEVTKNDLDGKVDTRILLVKYGYNQHLVDLSLDSGSRIFELRSVGQPYLLSEEGASSKYSGCRASISETIQKLIHKGNKDKIDLQLPARWAENGGRTSLVVFARLLDHDDISSLKKSERRDKEEALASAENLLKPTTRQLINEIGQFECLQYLVVIATYHDKGLKMDFTPYQEYWRAESSMVIGNTKYTTTTIGTTTELYQDMVLINKNPTFVFSYKLH